MNQTNSPIKNAKGAFFLMLLTFIWSCWTFIKALDIDKLWLKIMTFIPMVIFFGLLIMLILRIRKPNK